MVGRNYLEGTASLCVLENTELTFDEGRTRPIPTPHLWRKLFEGRNKSTVLASVVVGSARADPVQYPAPYLWRKMFGGSIEAKDSPGVGVAGTRLEGNTSLCVLENTELTRSRVLIPAGVGCCGQYPALICGVRCSVDRSRTNSLRELG
jgi:hypothetical protein